jgi:hypothetical protein
MDSCGQVIGWQRLQRGRAERVREEPFVGTSGLVKEAMMGRPSAARVGGPLQPFASGSLVELLEKGYGWTAWRRGCV